MDRPRPWHPFRHSGLCGLRGSLCVLSMISLIVVLPIILSRNTPVKASDDVTDFSFPAVSFQNHPAHADLTRHKRSDSGPLDPYSANWAPSWLERNLWFQHINYTVHTSFASSCLACQGYRTTLTLVSFPDNCTCQFEGRRGKPVCPLDCIIVRASRQTRWHYNSTLFSNCPDISLRTPTPPRAASTKILIAPNATFTCFNRTYGSMSVGATSVPCHIIHTLYRPRSASNPQSSKVGLEIEEDGSFGRRWKRDAFDAGIDPYPDLYWICDDIRRSLPGNWNGLCVIAMLAQEVHIIPISENVVSDLSVLPPQSRHHITKHAVVPFGSFDNAVT
ncbi:uncharacterized protein LOC128459776 [Pleuronectes platessa]|uniref:uncharacterized protein LOC128459776 n=1 Tax=Pleuronectes platessa TaxID=8262 RepID=UPI00232A5F33|nr:uncharacterized protein LOC128459776 [Pleuronectes platessa]